MERRVKLNAAEARILTEKFENKDAAQKMLAQCERELEVAATMLLVGREILRATVDGLEGDELLLTIPDEPKELQDADRRAESARPDTNGTSEGV